MPAGVPPRGGVNARIGFPISMAGLGWTATREGGNVIIVIAHGFLYHDTLIVATHKPSVQN